MGAVSRRSDRRAHTRYRIHDIACDVGSVIDVSQCGMRIVSDRLRRGAIELNLKLPNGKPLKVGATVEWHRALGPCEYSMGLRFCKQYPEITRLVSRGGQANRNSIASGQKTSRNTKTLQIIGIGLTLIIVPGLLAVVFSQAINPDANRVSENMPGLKQWNISTLLAAASATIATLLAISLIANRIFRNMIRSRDHLALRRSTTTLNAILDSSLGGVLVIEPVKIAQRDSNDFEIKLINRAAEDYLNRHAGNVLGQRLSLALPGLIDEQLNQRLLETMQSGYPIREKNPIEFEGRWFEFAALPIDDAIAVTFIDRTEEQRHIDLLRRSAYYDVLTRLPNRKLLVEKVQRELERLGRQKTDGFALLFIDLDGFKLINDGYGHDVGDAYLVEIADRISGNLREEDSAGRGRANAGGNAHPARLGGDEFVVLLEDVTDPQQAKLIGERILRALSEDIKIDEHRFAATASIGILPVTSDYKSVDAILRDADAAMYRAKTSGKGRCVLFDRNMREQVFKQVAIERAVRKAIDDSSFLLSFHPVLAVEGQQVVGIDVAVDWPPDSPERQSDISFIESLDAMSHTESLEQRYWSEVARQLKTWQNEHTSRATIPLALSVSQKQLLHPKLTAYLKELADTLNRGPAGLRINLHETAVTRDIDSVARVADQLNQAGYSLVLDDLGSGMLPLNCLQTLPIQAIKLDADLISHDNEHNDAALAIATAVVQLASTLDLELIAKGVHNSKQLEHVSSLGCQHIQGDVASQWCKASPINHAVKPNDSTNVA